MIYPKIDIRGKNDERSSRVDLLVTRGSEESHTIINQLLLVHSIIESIKTTDVAKHIMLL